MQPPMQVISSGFSRDEGQAKFTMATTEGAERLLNEFKGRKVEESDK